MAVRSKCTWLQFCFNTFNTTIIQTIWGSNDVIKQRFQALLSVCFSFDHQHHQTAILIFNSLDLCVKSRAQFQLYHIIAMPLFERNQNARTELQRLYLTKQGGKVSCLARSKAYGHWLLEAKPFKEFGFFNKTMVTLLHSYEIQRKLVFKKNLIQNHSKIMGGKARMVVGEVNPLYG